MANSYEKLRAHVSRGSIILTAFLLIALSTIAGCSSGDDEHAEAATAASQNFMTAYYQQNNAKGGLEFCTGDAKVKIAKEAAAIEKSGVSLDSARQMPTVTLKLDGYEKLSNRQYRVTWSVRSSAGQTIKVATTMVQPGNRWLVGQFVEDEK
jgi:hypothetical protein